MSSTTLTRQQFITECLQHFNGEVVDFDRWEQLNELSEEFCSFDVWERWCSKYNFA